jgi:RluA family pseudouridine synthase
VYEDDWIVVVDKPFGLPSQPTRDRRELAVDTILGKTRRYVALHHRLDRPASGLMVLACHPDANRGLAKAFSTRTAHRSYLAIVSGVPPTPTHMIHAPLDGKPATTRVELLGQSSGMSALRLSPRTGRFHQLRRHLAGMGLPLVGDRRYGGEVGTWLHRLALHACRLELTHPVTGEALDLRAPMPPTLGTPWQIAGGPQNVF